MCRLFNIHSIRRFGGGKKPSKWNSSSTQESLRSHVPAIDLYLTVRRRKKSHNIFSKYLYKKKNANSLQTYVIPRTFLHLCGHGAKPSGRVIREAMGDPLRRFVLIYATCSGCASVHHENVAHIWRDIQNGGWVGWGARWFIDFHYGRVVRTFIIIPRERYFLIKGAR